MSDPFWEDSPDIEAENRGQFGDGNQVRMLLPIALSVLVFVGSTMPWIVIRPFGDKRNSYNLTDVPGGIGVIITVFALAVVASVVMIWKRLSGMVAMSLSVSLLGWLAGISGLLLGLVGSLIPAIEVAGIDLSKAQVGQGPGVVVTVFASLLLAFMCVRQLPPFSLYSRSYEFPVIQIASLLPAILVTLTIHEGWLILGNPDAEWRAEVPGDSLYGSGLLIIGLWIVIGLWLTSSILRTPMVIRIAASLSIIVAAVTVGYAFLVWIGGKALSWLLPGSVEGWASVSVRPSLYLTVLSGIAIGVLGIVGLLTATRERVIKFKGITNFGSVGIPTSDLCAYIIFFFCALTIIYRSAT